MEFETVTILRDYQQDAYDAVIGNLRKTTLPLLLEAATGAGKSHIIAKIAEFIFNASGGNSVVCIAPSAELVTQNHEKYLLTGNKASIYSASAGSKCLRHPVIFGTPVTIKNGLKRFKKKISAIIIDEAHGITPTIKEVVEELRKANTNCRVIGLTATPYRMGTGYIFAEHPDGKMNTIENATEPFFSKMVYSIHAWDLIEKGWLTPPTMMPVKEHYDTSGLQLASTGKFTSESVDEAFIGQGRLTSQIIADVVYNSVNRKGVLIFCSTIAHAEEALESLPQHNSAIVTGDTPKKERSQILRKFKAQEIKYIVNVAILTTGFDAPHVDVVAVLRATESAGLFQQIIGRGLRLFEGKDDCLVLDYAENIERHSPDGDIFNPEIKAVTNTTGETISVSCPLCGGENHFKARHNDGDWEIDGEGYFIDLTGERVVTDEGEIPAHHGRRCQSYVSLSTQKEPVQCGYRWTHKVCPNCETENDIAARFCSECKGELVDPNEKLKLDFKRMKKDSYQKQVDIVTSCEASSHVSRAGNEGVKISWVTPYRAFTTYHTPNNYFWRKIFGDFSAKEVIEIANTNPPKTLTYRKQKESKFYEILGFDETIDEEPV